MGQKLYYETSLLDTMAYDLDSEIEDNKRYLERISAEIFALICMDPSKVRNQCKRSKDEDGDDYDWMNNAEYLSKKWEDLKEQYEETLAKLLACQDAKYATENKTRTVMLCPDCMVEVESGYDHKTFEWFYKCPKCGKVFKMKPYGPKEDEQKDEGPYPIEAIINTFRESC